ncbi:HAD family hydrolase [Flagellimonas lutaonensis]|uniref:Haloacid dehalogenase domain protein hydrolase n=1 Tax=Flagellimonas lutaonensis TaxID=516051 RepID=A0A0D5YNS3_9FLAO|nr:HAD family hydrolase [Allomuricauda lutaonensis]AKA33980.1 Haloacid dehalogenase domain protein hydrolase [Allomuricauda lutaonensis]
MEVNFDNITVIGFDADDTLWVNETYFREAEERFAELLERYETKNKIDQELFKVEMKNLELYGYGIKGFMLSMVECALDLSNNTVPQETISKILHLGKDMISRPVELLDGVEEVLQKLAGHYRLIVLTKGDLLDQERKLKRSGLSKYFHHVEVLSDKKEENYENLLDHLNIAHDKFLMIGNSLKSDILPILNIGAQAVHIPFHTTWVHELVSEEERVNHHLKLNNIVDILKYLKH